MNLPIKIPNVVTDWAEMPRLMEIVGKVERRTWCRIAVKVASRQERIHLFIELPDGIQAPNAEFPCVRDAANALEKLL